MKTTIQEQDDKMIAMLEGRLDTAASPETEKAMQPLFDCENQVIIIDCTKLDYISSSGLRIFLSVLKSAKPKGCHLYIKGLSGSLRQIFTMTGFINLFEFM